MKEGCSPSLDKSACCIWKIDLSDEYRENCLSIYIYIYVYQYMTVMTVMTVTVIMTTMH